MLHIKVIIIISIIRWVSQCICEINNNNKKRFVKLDSNQAFNRSNILLFAIYVSSRYLHCHDAISHCHFDQTPKLKFELVDVGGQRSERKKWIQCFDNVTAGADLQLHVKYAL